MVLDSIGLGSRVAQARQRANLTQEELARSSELDRSAIAKIETGARRLTALELARVAAAVRERIEWFLTDPAPSIVSHRNMSDPGEPSPPIDNALDRVTRAVEFTAQHDEKLRTLLGRLRTEPAPTTAAETEKLARLARRLLDVGADEPVHNLSSRLLRSGVLTFVLDLGTESADAGSAPLPSGAVAVINGSLRTGRRRMSLAHEFGHILIADTYTVDWRIASTEAGSREHTIDRFARALLLPSGALGARWREWGGDNAQTIRAAAVRSASHFRVDMATLARRLLDLTLINPDAADQIRGFRTGRADIVAHALIVADELPSGELPREYEAAVLRLHASETIGDVRALDLLLDTWPESDLPPLAPRAESEMWQFVS